jgi:putative spermidine/putrescine transport system permease protein
MAARTSLAEKLIINGATAAVLLVMLLPIACVILISFTSSHTIAFPPPGLSLRWYQAAGSMLFGADADIVRLRESLTTSLLIAGLTSLVCAAAGIPAAYALVRGKLLASPLVNELIDLPIVFPAIVLGVALLMLVSALPFDLGIAQLVIAHSVIALPFMIRNVVAALQRLDPGLEEAARVLGASPLMMFKEIVLPLVKRGVVSGLLIVFALSFNEFTLSYFLYTVDAFPLSIWLFQQGNTMIDPTIFAVSTVMIFINLIIILLVDRIGEKSSSPLVN